MVRFNDGIFLNLSENFLLGGSGAVGMLGNLSGGVTGSEGGLISPLSDSKDGVEVD